jgi:BioD-like phosphotransacetylase family protein
LVVGGGFAAALGGLESEVEDLRRARAGTATDNERESGSSSTLTLGAAAAPSILGLVRVRRLRSMPLHDGVLTTMVGCVERMDYWQ